MLKALPVVLALILGGGGGVYSYTLSKQVDEQKLEIARLRKQVSSIEVPEAPTNASIAASSFDLPTSNSLAEVGGGIDGDELRELVARMVKDEGMVSALAQNVGSQIDTPQAFIASDAFREGVRTTMEELEEQERQERNERRAQQMIERTEERAQEIAEQLELPAGTAQELTNILVESAQARTDMWTMVRAGEFDRGEMRDMMREARDETNAQVQNILTADEYKKYEEIQQNDRGRGFGGFGGGRNNRGNNNRNTGGNTGGNTAGGEAAPTRGGRGGF